MTITGTPTQGQTLTAANTLADADGLGSITYTWSNSATGATVVLAESDVGDAMTVTATYTDGTTQERPLQVLLRLQLLTSTMLQLDQ